MMMSLVRAVLLGVVGFACAGCETEIVPSPVDERAAFVLAHIDQAHITFSFHVSESDTRDVRDYYVMLYVPRIRLAPVTRYSDGSPVGSARQVSADAMRIIVQALQDDGFFNKSERYHSEAIASPPSDPPADSIDYASVEHPTSYPSGALEVKLVLMADGWHHYFVHAYPQTYDSRDLLIGIAENAPAEIREDLEADLLGKMR